MEPRLTLGLAAACIVLSAFFGWRGALPPDLMKGPRLTPHRLLMVTFAAAAMLFLIHFAALLRPAGV